MHRIFCPSCRLEQPTEHRYCVRCGTTLPTELIGEQPRKSARFFTGMKVADGDPEHGFLKISCYLKEQRMSDGDTEMVIPGHHVRFSVWIDDTAKCVLSLPLAEARGVADFLTDELKGIDDTLVAEMA